MTATTSETQSREAEFFAYMQGSHQTLERVFEQLLAAVTLDDRIEIRDTWARLERQLLSHLEAEERFVLPAFARVDQKEAVELVREHGKIRELLLEMGVAIDLHYARLTPFQDFIAMLRTHAHREESLLYRWAAQELDARLAAAALEHAHGA